MLQITSHVFALNCTKIIAANNLQYFMKSIPLICAFKNRGWCRCIETMKIVDGRYVENNDNYVTMLAKI